MSKLTPLKIIFLDIDGVLNTSRAHIAFESSKWDPVGVAILKRVCEETGAKLVISSVWRGSMESWIHAHQLLDAVGLGKEGLCSGHLGLKWSDDTEVHRTEPGHDNPRGEKIQKWIDTWNPDEYAILDDDRDMLSSQAKHFAHVNGHEGIGYGTYKRLIDILGKGDKPGKTSRTAQQQLNIPLVNPEMPNHEERKTPGVWEATYNITLSGIHADDQDEAISISKDLVTTGIIDNWKFNPTIKKMTPEEYKASQSPKVFGDGMLQKKKDKTDV